MSSGITLTAATRQNLLSLQGTADLLTQTQNRLSTGKKVNSALDDPTSFFTSQSLSGRSGDLGSLLNGISNGVQTIQAANQGITSIQKLVDSAKSTANQALADKSAVTSGTPATSAILSAGTSFQGTTTAATDGTQDFSASRNAVFTVNDGTNTTTITLDASTLSGVTSNVGKATADDVVKAINNQLANDTSNPAAVSASKTTDGRIVFTSTATGKDATATVTNAANNEVDLGFGTATTALTAKGADAKNGATAAAAEGAAVAGLATGGTGPDFTGAADASFTIKLGDGPAKKIELNTAADATLGALTDAKATDLATAINKQLNADTGFKGKVTAVGDDTTGKVTFTSTATGSDQKITIDASSAATDTDIGFGAGATAKPVVASGAGSASGTNATRTSLAKQFNTLLDQITQQAKDSSYNGINLLYRSGSDAKENSLKVTFNETGSSNLNIEGAKLDSDGLGLTSITGGFQSDDEINKALTAITAATSQLRAQSSTFGSNLSVVQNRQDFSKNLINILDTGSANLTNADLNEEAANSQALSTRQSIGISALSLANTAQQGILQLLR
ncbi:flagellin [Methylobacterium sp. 10]|uniref:flagellin N-terminal helical domain-containing protein n=1 Tax=Methylobacterium sp. 10 TaxID=1101191 RepID=UPI000483BE16|nr:flagellin [Methylobacterium sp. 10]